MKAKPIVPRELANRDVDEAIEHYLSEGAERAALGFIKSLEQAYTAGSGAGGMRNHG